MHAPAIVSVNQCAARYVRLIAISPANAPAQPMASQSPRRRRPQHDHEAERGDSTGDRVTGWERRAAGGDERVRGSGPVDQRLERTDAQLRRDDCTDERAELQPPAMPGQNQRHDDPQWERDHHRAEHAHALGDTREPRCANGNHLLQPPVVDRPAPRRWTDRAAMMMPSVSATSSNPAATISACTRRSNMR